MRSNSWRALRRGTTGRTIATVDFVSTQSRATFSDFAALLNRDDTVLRTMPPPKDGADLRADPARFLDHWAPDLLAHAGELVSIVGFCAGSAFAWELSRIVAAAGRPAPHLVLIDPEPVLDETLLYQLDKAVRALRPGPTAGAPVPTAAPASNDLPGLAAVLVGEYRQVAEETFKEQGLQPYLADELADHFGDYLDYLCAAAKLDSDAVYTGGRAVLSRDFPYPDAWTGRSTTFDVAVNDLLCHQPAVDDIASVPASRPAR